MKKFFLLLLFTSCTYETVNNYYYGVDLPISEMSVKEKQLLDIINNYRQNHVPKLGILKPERLATIIAIKNTDRMILEDSANHDGFHSRQLESRAKRFSENLEKNINTPYAMFMGYYNSPSHKAVMDREDMTHLSISIKENFNTCIFTNYNTIKNDTRTN